MPGKKELTPFEIIRENEFHILQSEAANIYKAADDVLNQRLSQTIIKGKSVIHSKLSYGKRFYNEKSRMNLVQFSDDDFNDLHEKRKKDLIDEKNDVNTWAASYIAKYEERKEKKFSYVPGKSTMEKIYKCSSVFVRSVISGFRSERGFRQRSISFCTFTLTEPQKHTDDVIIKTFVDFIDHLKKVKNYLIDPVTKERTKEEGLVIDNYFWRAETQENGNIHFHLIADVFLNQDMLRRTWNNYIGKLGYVYGYGASNVNSLKRDKRNNKIGNIENYICKYLTKPPLKNAYKNSRRSDLEGIPAGDKYRRPVLGRSWGCSKKLLKLEYPKFYGSRAVEVFNKLKKYLKEYKNASIPDYINIFFGNVRGAFKMLSYDFQRDLKSFYLIALQFLYDEIPIN